MVSWKRVWYPVLAVVLLAGVGGCGGTEPVTAPDEQEHPAIPQLTQAACGEWSCSINDCNNDPAVYGACCTTVADAENPVQPRPSCTAPNTSPYCAEFSGRCQSGENTTNLNPPAYCYHANPDAICADQRGCNALEGAAKEQCIEGCSNASYSGYSECFGDGDPDF